MINSVVLSVTIGIIFIFLLYSLLASIIQEIFSNWLGMRQRFLVKIIDRMLQDGQYGSDNAFKDYWKDIVEGIKRYFNQIPNGQSFIKAFYCYPLIKYLGENRLNTKPSYITADVFSQTIIALLGGEATDQTTNQMTRIKQVLFDRSNPGFEIEDDTRKYLKKLWTDSGGDVNRFRSYLELWFIHVQERGAGWYKRNVQAMLFFIGFGLAAGFNVDAIAISKLLSKDSNVREQLVSIASSKANAYQNAAIQTNGSLKDTQVEEVYQKLNRDAEEARSTIALGLGKDLGLQPCAGLTFCGWIITALAISLGAPFWFDLLNKIMVFRASGKKPTVKSKTEVNNINRVG